ATALAIGSLISAGTLTRSVSATSDAKALVFTGSDVAVTVAEDVSVPAALRRKATVVKVIESGYLLPDQQPLNILGVDRRTFADGAFWDPSFAGKSLPDLLEDLTPPTDPGGPLPMLVA